MDAKYEKVNVDDVVDSTTLVSCNETTLGVYPHRTFHIDIMPDSKPKLVRPDTIARIHLKHFKKELNHLVCTGVLSLQGASEWGSPMFITPKKDGRISWVSDLCELNKVV